MEVFSNFQIATGDINFENIHFRYPTRPQVEVLRGLRLSLAAGRTLALVGPSGCGKSTLLHLLMRSYDPDSGQVVGFVCQSHCTLCILTAI